MWEFMKRNPITVGAVTVVAVIVLAVVVLAAIPGGDDDADDTQATEQTEQAEESDESEDSSPARGFIAATDLKVGDCVRDAKGSGDGDGRQFKAVNCARRHGGEVYTIIKLPGERYPGLKSVVAKGQRGCRARLRRDFPATYNDQSAGFTFVYPTSATWDEDFRQITCLASFEKKRRGELTV